MTVKNKVVVITGASSGIGATTAKQLASNGAKVVLGARREERLAALVDEIKAAGGQAAYQVTDVTKSADVQALVKLAQTQFGGLDVIFNNAGLCRHRQSVPCTRMNGTRWLILTSKAS